MRGDVVLTVRAVQPRADRGAGPGNPPGPARTLCGQLDHEQSAGDVAAACRLVPWDWSLATRGV